jgi:EAL domain-containing protein (putative c-di-GMP-specific phosphodiesterase class I)
VVHYQPVVDLGGGYIIGFEALVRWLHPTKGLVGPGHFLPDAEETGTIIEIGQSVARSAIAQLGEWQRRFPRTPRLWMSINLSVRGLSHPPLIESVADNLSSRCVAADDVVFEITETMLLEETAGNLARLHDLKDLGVRLALDDFGTAFSSLSYLRRFPFDFIKMDSQFTAELPHEPRSALLMAAVLQLADTLGLEAIAEGVEREDQAQALRAAGWRYAQGYLYSQPQPAANYAPMLRAAPSS